jgi:hypothetical protein
MTMDLITDRRFLGDFAAIVLERYSDGDIKR